MEHTTDPLLDSVLGEVLGAGATPDSDEAIPTRGLEARIGNDWIPVTSDVWSSWTGRRRIWGMEHHGPVYAFGAPEGTPPWTGARECYCSSCQAHVEPTLRPN